MENRLTPGRQMVEEVRALLLERGHDGHHGLDNPDSAAFYVSKLLFRYRTPRRMTCSAPLFVVPSLGGTQRSSTPDHLEDLPTDPFGFGHATGLVDFQQPLHLLPDGPYVGSEGGMRKHASPARVPPGVYLAHLRPERPGNLL
jgi:hypothetical protein